MVTPVPTDVTKAGLRIEFAVTVLAHKLRVALAAPPGRSRATWNATCVADMGDRFATAVREIAPSTRG